MTDISVIIVSYNVKELLLQCIRSVYKHAGSLSLEIIVIDNDSRDDSVTAISKEFPAVIVIANKFNAGFSGANNQGIAAASGKFILLLNPDTEITGDALAQLHELLTSDPGIAVVGPRLLNRDKSLQASAWKHPLPVDMVLETFFGSRIRRLDYPAKYLDDIAEVDSLSGAALFFRRTLIASTGTLDERLFWMEDIDFCSRAAANGRIVYLPSAEIIHYSGESQRKNFRVAISNQLLSKLKYYRKHFSLLQRWPATVCCFFFILSRLTVFALLMPVKEVYRLKMNAYAYSMKRYWRYILFNEYSVT